MRTLWIAPLFAAACLLFAICGLAQQTPEAAPLAVVSLTADGNTLQVYTSAATVADVLREVNLRLRRLDRVDPPPPTEITDGLEIRVTRVSKRRVTEVVTVPADTVLLADPERPSGFSRVLEEGRDGLVKQVVEIWEKDGEETARTVVKEQVLVQARDTVVLRGSRGLSTRGGDWRHPLRMHATAYEPGPRSCGRYASGYTATGVRATKGVVAVDDRVIPMGSRLYIPGYGFAIAADRGRAIKGRRIDLCFDTYREAMLWGRRQVNVYLLD
jgi:3D (Asp-Asp-Asp) domain-containing protein